MASKSAIENTTGSGGETHQQASDDNVLTTNQGIRISDNQNQLKAGARPGPAGGFCSARKDFPFRP